MTEPLIIVNFKAYAEVDGISGRRLAEICESVSKKTGKYIAVCPPVVELASTADAVSIDVFSQNIDPVDSGSQTGWITASMIKSAKAKGTLINHSEHRFTDDKIKICVDNCKKLGLISIVCAENISKVKSVAGFKPDFIAVEPPELIGGDVSVTSANPEIISNCVSSVKSVSPGTKVLCGAGIKNGADVRKAIELGADGVLIASGVVKSSNPEKTLLDLISQS